MLAAYSRIMLTIKILAAYKRIIVPINIDNDITCIISGADNAFIISGVAAKIAIIIAIKCVIALPGSFIFLCETFSLSFSIIPFLQSFI